MSASSRPSESMALMVSGSRFWRRHDIAPLRRLLRRHLVHLARMQIDPDAADLVQVGASHAHEGRLFRIMDRVDLAVLVDAGVAGFESILLLGRKLGVLGILAVVLALPLGYIGPELSLAVD